MVCVEDNFVCVLFLSLSFSPFFERDVLPVLYPGTTVFYPCTSPFRILHGVHFMDCCVQYSSR